MNKIILSTLLSLLVMTLSGCGGSTSSGTTGGNGTIVVPLAGWWLGTWSRNTTLTDVINDTEDVTTQTDPTDGVVTLEITAADLARGIVGNLLMTGFECFTSANVSGTWSGSNIGLTAVDAYSTTDSGSRVASIAVTTAGSSYTQSTTTVSISAPDIAGGTQATATVTVGSSSTIVAYVMTNFGSGYTIIPAVTITDTGSGVGAVATAALETTSDASTLSLSGHQTSAGQIKLAYSVASGDCAAKRGSITLNKS